MEPLIFHIDVNSAYLSWTSTENVRTGTGPDLRLLPAIIGGDQKNRHGSPPAARFEEDAVRLSPSTLCDYYFIRLPAKKQAS